MIKEWTVKNERGWQDKEITRWWQFYTWCAFYARMIINYGIITNYFFTLLKLILGTVIIFLNWILDLCTCWGVQLFREYILVMRFVSDRSNKEPKTSVIIWKSKFLSLIEILSFHWILIYFCRSYCTVRLFFDLRNI